jgi:hypothetical protein
VDQFRISNNSLSYLVSAEYPNDLINSSVSWSSIQMHFNPALGFLYRKNYDALNSHFNFTPRWLQKFGIKQFDFSIWDFSYFLTQSTKQLESWNNLSRPFGILMQSGESFQWNVRESFDRIDVPFHLASNAVIPAGSYNMHTNEFVFSTNPSRKMYIGLLYNWGTFYSGSIKTFTSAGGINFNKHINLDASYSYTIIYLPGATVISHQLSQDLNYAFSNRIDLSLFSQWNSLDDIMLFNFRLHWIPKIGTDLYMVYNRGYDALNQLDLLRPATTAGAVKLIWRFTF